ncbi:MAG: dienelactone hydrolase [Proteobacteria bacterium]|nr:MAG: dienelactone hydrolase [Pseudomonadota bacterium]
MIPRRKHKVWWRLGLLLVGLSATLSPDTAGAAIVEETIDLPVVVTTGRGDVVQRHIMVMIVRDEAVSRAPFLLLNHGRAGDSAGRQSFTPTIYHANARYFVSRGFAVFVPVRIGYGASGGPDIENGGACEAKHFPPAYEAAAEQGLAVIAFAKKQKYVDPARGIVVGQSFGGATAIALASKSVPGVLAAVNFAGGGGGDPDNRPEHPCGADRMAQLFGSYGATSHIPTLWLYSANDRYWGPTWPRTWHRAFLAHGGSGRLVELPPYKSDGHRSFTGNPDAWKPEFEAFLQSCCPSLRRSAATALPARFAAARLWRSFRSASSETHRGS